MSGNIVAISDLGRVVTGKTPSTKNSSFILDVVDVDRDVILVVNRLDGKTDVKKAGETQLQAVRDNLLRLGELFVIGDLQLALFDTPGEPQA